MGLSVTPSLSPEEEAEFSHFDPSESSAVNPRRALFEPADGAAGESSSSKKAEVSSGTADDGQQVAERYIAELEEDVVVVPQGPDSPSRLTAAGEAYELALGDMEAAEKCLRRALVIDGRSAQAGESLRRIYRAAGNWRSVAFLLNQELTRTSDEARRAQLTLALEVLLRTRSDVERDAQSGDTQVGEGLAPVYGRLQTLLDASAALSDRKVNQALELRRRMWQEAQVVDGDGDGDGEESEPVESRAVMMAAHDEWVWSEANLRRFLNRDSRGALDLLMGLFERGRREHELLEALGELLTEHREWDRLRRVYENLIEGQHARSEDFEALASLLEVRYRDLPAAAEVLEAGVSRFPQDRTLARRLVDVLEVLERGDQGQSLIDAIGNLVNLEERPEVKADLLWRMGRLFEEATGITSAALEVLHEALVACPHHGPTLRTLGRIYTRQNNWYGLADLYEKELAAPDPLPDSWRRHFQVAEIYEARLGLREAALRHYRAAIEARPSFLPALLAMIRLHSEDGDWEELVGLLAKMADKVRSRRRQIDLLERASRLCEAHLDNPLKLRELLERLLALDPESPRVIEALGRLYQGQREWEKLIALHLREAGLTEDVEETATLFWQCGQLAEDELGDVRRAEEYYRQALRTVPAFLPALEGLCRLLDREQRFEEIMSVSRDELEGLESSRARMRRMEAMADLLELRLRRRTAAIELVEAMTEEFPDEAAPMRRLARLYAAQGKWDLVSDLVERRANLHGDSMVAAELWCQLGEVRERKLADESGALEAFGRCLERDPDHPHALRGAHRTGQGHEQVLETLMARVSQEAQDESARRLARRHMARAAEQSSGNPAAAIELRQDAVAEAGGSDDREARDMLEAAYAWRGHLPGLAGLWAAAGRSFEEGLLGLLGVSAGIDASGLLEAFLERWGDQLDDALSLEGHRGLWHAALGELSRHGVEVLADPNRLPQEVWSRLPDAVRRRAAISLLPLPGGPGLARAALDRGRTIEPASLRLRALLAGGDRKAAVSATRAEVQGLASPELRVRRLLEISMIPGVEARACLADAVAEETYQSPIQEDLYARLEEGGHDRLLRRAIEGHLCADGLSATRRSHLAFRLGQALERLEVEPAESFDAYRTSYQSGQERHEALRHMARLAEEQGDPWESIRCLEAFLTICNERDERLDAGLSLSRLLLSQVEPPEQPSEYDPYAGPTQYDGGPCGRKALDLLTRLREEARGAELELTVISKLAHAHAQVGSAYKAVDLFQEVLTPEFHEEQIDDYLALAEVYSASLEDLTHAEQVLRVVFDASPERVDVLERLMAVSRKNESLPETCALIDQVARLAAPEVLDAAARRRLLRINAGLLDEELGHHTKAAAIWEELADGAATPKEQRRLRVAQALALSHVSGEERQCHSLMLDLQREEPFDLAPYEGLAGLYEDFDDYTRLRVVQQVRGVLDPEFDTRPDAHGRRKTLPARSLDVGLIHQCLLPEGLRDGVLETLRALEPLAVKVWGDALPTIDALGGRRWRAGGDYEQVRDFAVLAAQTFELPSVRVYLGDGGPAAPQVFTQGAVSLWFHQGMFNDVGAEVGRYLAGYAAGLAWSGCASLVHLDGRDLWHLLEAVLIKHTGVGLTETTDPRSMELIEKVGGFFNQSLRRRIVTTATPHLDVLRTAHCEAWPAMLNQLATRSGLVLSGQLSGAVQAVLRSRQWRGELHDADTQERLRKLPEAADLLRFSLSDDYLELRHGCGLDSRPRRSF